MRPGVTAEAGPNTSGPSEIGALGGAGPFRRNGSTSLMIGASFRGLLAADCDALSVILWAAPW